MLCRLNERGENMKKILFVLLGACLLSFLPLQAQPTEVVVTSEELDQEAALHGCHDWVKNCDISKYDSASKGVNVLGIEHRGGIYDDGSGYWYKATGRLATPLQKAVMDETFSVWTRPAGKDEKCPPSRKERIIQELLSAGANPNDGLYHPVRNGKYLKVELFPDPVMGGPEIGTGTYRLVDTPLGYAARHGKYEMAELLLRNGADPNYTWEGFWQTTEDGGVRSDDYAHFPLEQVVASSAKTYNAGQRARMIALLRKWGADANAVDDAGMTPLARLIMCHCGQDFSCPRFSSSDAQTIGRALLNAGANPKVKGKNNRPGMGGMSAQEIVKNYCRSTDKNMWEDLLKSSKRK